MPRLDNQERDLDARIGDRIRARRVHLGLSQADLALLIGMSFQQVQKYERGSNRIASSILLRVAEALDCPPSYLLGVDKEPKSKQKWIEDIAADKETSKLMQRFYRISSPKIRRRILLVLDALLKEVESAASSPGRSSVQAAPPSRAARAKQPAAKKPAPTPKRKPARQAAK